MLRADARQGRLAERCYTLRTTRRATRSRSFFGKRLQQTPSGLFWLEMAEQVLRNPLPAPLPFREASYVPADEVQAIA